MRELLRKHHISFKNAFAGLRWAVSTQPNFRVHMILAAAVVSAGWYFQITKAEWIVIVFTIVLGFAGEMVNTAIEAMTDLITDKWHKSAKIAKDVSAGMMLTIAAGAMAVAAVVFVPYLWVIWR